jgi:hypothetical protein
VLYFDSDWLIPQRLEAYRQAVLLKLAPRQTCWGFVDCTVQEISETDPWARTGYNSLERFHCFKYQSTVTQDGLICHPWGL